MGGSWSGLARGIKGFVEDPVTNLIEGPVIFLIGLSDATRTLGDDPKGGHVRVGHGPIIIGVFAILEALPHLIDGLGAWVHDLDVRGKGPDARGSPRDSARARRSATPTPRSTSTATTSSS